MATSQITFTDDQWQEVGTTLTVALVQGMGTGIQVHVGGVAPALT